MRNIIIIFSFIFTFLLSSLSLEEIAFFPNDYVGENIELNNIVLGYISRNQLNENEFVVEVVELSTKTACQRYIRMRELNFIMLRKMAEKYNTSGGLPYDSYTITGTITRHSISDVPYYRFCIEKMIPH